MQRGQLNLLEKHYYEGLKEKGNKLFSQCPKCRGPWFSWELSKWKAPPRVMIFISLGFASMAALQVLTLPVTEIWKLFLLKSSWFLIPRHTRQARHPKFHKILWKSLLGYGNQRGPGLDKSLGLLKVRSVFNQMPSQTHRTFLLGSLLDSL